jgi:hypothetical protein
MSHCNCHCHDEFDDDDEIDHECPECGEIVDENAICQTKDCDWFGHNPFGDGVPEIDEAKWERQQMGICG